ncbi:protein kinase domain-containing protein [Nocardia brasiliensis]|uniref:protein kinase domain-containing protein n=1 Tax=Nocardia brasiliensis TaxID=37326 RepID=UPI002454D2A3|nr:protein kinase [Nocardia brasiliensis]
MRRWPRRGKYRPLSAAPEQAARIVEDVGAALDFAHQHGVLHRDVKPANILLGRSPDGQMQPMFLADFGIARLREDSVRATRTGTITALAFASPEQLTGAPIGPSSDQHSRRGRPPTWSRAGRLDAYNRARSTSIANQLLKPRIPRRVTFRHAARASQRRSGPHSCRDEFVRYRHSRGHHSRRSPVSGGRPSGASHRNLTLLTRIIRNQ